MPQNFIVYFSGIALLLCLFASVPIYAQSGGEQAPVDAYISPGMQITLDEDAPVKNTYTADISELALENEEAAIKMFNRISNNLVQFTLNWDAQTVTVHVHNERLKEPRTIAEWNSYFEEDANNQ